MNLQVVGRQLTALHGTTRGGGGEPPPRAPTRTGKRVAEPVATKDMQQGREMARICWRHWSSYLFMRRKKWERNCRALVHWKSAVSHRVFTHWRQSAASSKAAAASYERNARHCRLTHAHAQRLNKQNCCNANITSCYTRAALLLFTKTV